ncbi:hypothetical protein ABKN59_005951 [Abortiporus biennis]
MLPRPRKPGKKETNLDETLQEVNGPGTSQTSKGLLSLPVELFDQILSDYPRAEEKHIIANKTTLDRKFAVHAKVLRALSQTCKSLRYVQNAFLDFGSKSNSGLMAAPEIASLVKIVTVTFLLSRCPSPYSTVFLFVRCLRKLPNLHTLHVLYAHSQTTTALKDAFEPTKLPQIRTLILPNHAHDIIRSCSQARTITCNEGDGERFLNAIDDACPNIRSLRNIDDNEALLTWLPKSIPTLEEISVKIRPYIRVQQSFYQHLRKSNNLTTIELLISQHTNLKATWTREVIDWHISAAREPPTLKGNDAVGRKNYIDITLTEPFTRAQASLLVQLRTSHIPLNHHLHRINKSSSPGCPPPLRLGGDYEHTASPTCYLTWTRSSPSSNL